MLYTTVTLLLELAVEHSTASFNNCNLAARNTSLIAMCDQQYLADIYD